jgi:uncharacterized membrane protein
MPRVCSKCAAEMPDVSSFCAACGTPIGATKPQLGTTGGLNDQFAGALAYFTVIPAIIFLLVEPYNRNRFIRCHAFQCILVAIAGVALSIALRLVFFILTLVPILGHLTALLLSLVVVLGWLCLWVVLAIKALQGEIFKLPLLGDLAEKQANSH